MSFSNPSRFIKDIDPAFLDYPADFQSTSQTSFYDDTGFSHNKTFKSFPSKARKSYVPRNTTIEHPIAKASSSGQTANLKRLSSVDKSASSDPNYQASLPIGAFVKHEKFGIGKVLAVTLAGSNEKAEIDFGEQGKKTLLLKFARLELLK